MKLANPSPAAHWNLSTPVAARNLLRLFAITLVAGVFIGAYSYMRMTLNEEVSFRRRYMNEAIFKAQDFFISRQTLLRSLGLSTVKHTASSSINEAFIPGEEVHVFLRQPSGTWSLWLTPRMLSFLQIKQTSLLYVSNVLDEPVTWLFSRHELPPSVPNAVLQRLRGSIGEPGHEQIWLAHAGGAETPSLYIFIAMDERDPASGWLGLEVEGPQLLAALKNEQAGKFQLVDSASHIIASEDFEQQLTSTPNTAMPVDDGFGWEGGPWFANRLTIRKQLDHSDWQMVYSIPLASLIPALILPFGLAMLISIVVTLLMLWLVQRVDLRLISPAVARIEALVESEAFSSAVIRTAPVALCVLRRSDGAVVLANRLSEQWLVMGDERTKACQDWIARAFGEAGQTSYTEELQMANGRHLCLSYAPTRYRREDVLVCAFSDITERKTAELSLQQARALADAANEAKTLFLATMSHEIRTPLYGMLATLELLSRTHLDSQQRGYLNAIEGSSATLLQLICDVLDVSKIEAGQLALEVSAFSPVELTQEVMQGYMGAADKKGLQLLSCIDPHLPEQVLGDTTRTRQILGNLLSNAVKFTSTGRIVVRLHLVGVEGERMMLRWQVVDTGQGIPEQDQQHLFEPFFQSGPSTNTVAGTGLGLSICKRLVELMSGSIRVFSEPGLGSSFSFTLPFGQLALNDEPCWAQRLLSQVVAVYSSVPELADHAAGWLRRWGACAQVMGVRNVHHEPGTVLVEICPGPASSACIKQWPGPLVLVCADGHGISYPEAQRWQLGLHNLQSLNQAVSQAQGIEARHPATARQAMIETKLCIHVLVTEDNVINQLILRDQLEKLGCTVTLASDGEEALALCQVEVFDLVLTDVNMPKVNGYQLAQRLRQQGQAIPIVGATANAMLDEAERCLGAGMDQFLVKPFTLHALYQCLLPYRKGST
ncbi:ATP-binding protein [Pseudomonas juntendi]|uniref:histidine kinase n=1 Tax=Pseudomonas juntendi TaxID=2666183 RepID=A0A7W2PUD7_9PSED|nr:ATP-binding protein [Pseudomonas juntendi]MBA6061147.1 response regulator [Pseudomonas juntendi]MBA6128293.1 response regulator [Pseudomonas juntendi]